MSYLIDLSTLYNILAFVGLVLAVVLPITGASYFLVKKLGDIERNTEPIKDIQEVMIRLDERTKNLPIPPPATTKLTLPRLGEVTVSANPSLDTTYYDILISEHILIQGVYARLYNATDSPLSHKEVELFGTQVRPVILASNSIRLIIPSINAEKCTTYIGFFLKWLDSYYFPKFAPDKAPFENIKLD